METKSKILFVDDEPHILNSIKRILRKEDYYILTAPSGEEGLKILKDHKVHLVISDQRMPGLSGIEFLQIIKKKYPQAVRAILSGYAEADAIMNAINKGEIYKFFTKPWEENDLKTGIRQCLKHYELQNEILELILKIQIQNRELKTANQNFQKNIEEKTGFLQLYQEIFENLSMPVAGISQEMFIAASNKEFNRMFSNITLGNDIKSIFPEFIINIIEDCFNGKTLSKVQGSFKGITVNAHCEPLKENEEIISCILMLGGI